MQARAFYTFLGFVCLVMAVPALAQEGYPLDGSWHGDRGPAAPDRTQVTLIMAWDGTVVTGVVNPGFDQAALQNAKLNPKDWTVHFEVDLKDKSGKPAHCLVDGKLDKLGSDRRTLTGTWNCGTVKADFKLIRDRDYYHSIGDTKQ